MQSNLLSCTAAALTNQGTFGKLKVKLNMLSSEYDLTSLSLTESRGGRYFLKWVFQKLCARKRTKEEKNNVLLVLICHVKMIILSWRWVLKRADLWFGVLAILTNFLLSHLPHCRRKTRRALFLMSHDSDMMDCVDFRTILHTISKNNNDKVNLFYFLLHKSPELCMYRQCIKLWRTHFDI